MAIKKVSVVDQIEITRDGGIGVRLALELVDGGEVLSSQFHRTLIIGGVTAADQMGAVNAHLVEMGWPQIDEAAIVRLTTLQNLTSPVIRPAHHTDEAQALPVAEE